MYEQRVVILMDRLDKDRHTCASNDLSRLRQAYCRFNITKEGIATYPIRDDAGGGALRGLNVEDARTYERPPGLFMVDLGGGLRGGKWREGERKRKGYGTYLPNQVPSTRPYLIVMCLGRLHNADILHSCIP